MCRPEPDGFFEVLAHPGRYSGGLRELRGQLRGNAGQFLERGRRFRTERRNGHDAGEPQPGGTGQLFGQAQDLVGGGAAPVRRRQNT